MLVAAATTVNRELGEGGVDWPVVGVRRGIVDIVNPLGADRSVTRTVDRTCNFPVKGLVAGVRPEP